MPELPDLQVFSHNLNKLLHGKTVKNIRIENTSKLSISPGELKSTLVGQSVKKIYREGKELHLQFSKGDVLGLHLMLRGKLYIFEDKNEHKYTIIEVLFTDGTGLVLTDFQGQATPTLNPGDKDAPDALSDTVNYKLVKEHLGKTRSSIKNVLLDQHFIRGIGNAYADEILWDAGISPFSISNKIPDSKVKSLVKSIKAVLENAEKQIRKTHPDIIAGEVRDFLKIHNPGKTESPSGAPILVKKGSRKTYYTREQAVFK